MKLNQAFRLNEVAGEKMLINAGDRTVNRSLIFSLNEPAAWLWEKIGTNDFSEALLVDWLCESYEVSREIATEDVSNMVKLWREYGMLIPDND